MIPVVSTEVEEAPVENTEVEKPKSTRGRKRKYATDEERILARREQQRAYRKRKKNELAALKAFKAEWHLK